MTATLSSGTGASVFLLPDLGEGLTEAEVLQWRVAVGDVVEVDQVVVEVETAKAAVEVPCPYAGRVAALHAGVGEQVPVGRPLLTVEPLPDGQVDPLPDGSGDPEPAAYAAYREEERAGSGNVLIGYGTGHGGLRRRRRRALAPGARAAGREPPGHGPPARPPRPAVPRPTLPPSTVRQATVLRGPGSSARSSGASRGSTGSTSQRCAAPGPAA